MRITNEKNTFDRNSSLWTWSLFFWPEPEPEPENKPSDTGLTREETEALMRKIGYVQ